MTLNPDQGAEYSQYCKATLSTLGDKGKPVVLVTSREWDPINEGANYPCRHVDHFDIAIHLDVMGTNITNVFMEFPNKFTEENTTQTLLAVYDFTKAATINNPMWLKEVYRVFQLEDANKTTLQQTLHLYASIFVGIDLVED
jgi:hypothetical protein